MPARNKRKQLVSVTAASADAKPAAKKRPRKSDGIQTSETRLRTALSDPGLRKVIRLQNINRHSSQVYNDLRIIGRVYMDKILTNAYTYCHYDKRKTLSRDDVERAMKSISRRIY